MLGDARHNSYETKLDLHIIEVAAAGNCFVTRNDAIMFTDEGFIPGHHTRASYQDISGDFTRLSNKDFPEDLTRSSAKGV